MWESPVYKFAKKRPRASGKVATEVITIDVTGSAPTMPGPGAYLEGVFSALTQGRNPKKTSILDFGAAKLRNTLFLLDAGYQVRAVEFPELASRMARAQENWEKAGTYPNFRKIVFPKDFYALKDKIDIALFVNVMNVIPIPNERLVALALCRKKMREGGLLYWLNWKPASSDPKTYAEKNSINDGWYRGVGRERKTFHAEWTKDEAYEMLSATGFSRSTTIDIEPSSSQSYVFSADRPILLNNFLKLAEVERGGLKRDPNTVLPEVQRIPLMKAYLEELETVGPGQAGASKYHHITTRLIAGVFDDQLKNPEMEAPIGGNLGYVDVKFKNRNEPGFFKNVKELHDLKCPSVWVECKNYNEDIGNPEFDQLSGRLDNPERGQLGILTCRKIIDRKKVLEHCQEKFKIRKCLIVLCDKDLIQLVKLKFAGGEDTVDDFMEEKLDEIID